MCLEQSEQGRKEFEMKPKKSNGVICKPREALQAMGRIQPFALNKMGCHWSVVSRAHDLTFTLKGSRQLLNGKQSNWWTQKDHAYLEPELLGVHIYCQRAKESVLS